MIRVVNLLERWRWTFLAAVALLTCAALLAARGIELEESPEAYLSEDDPALRFQETFEATFGAERSVAVTLELLDSVGTRRGLAELAALTRRLREVEQVLEVTSLATLETARADGDAIRVGPVLPDPGTATGEEVAEAWERIRRDPRVAEVMVSADGRVTTLHLRLQPLDGADRASSRRMLAGIDGALAESGVQERAHVLGLEPVADGLRSSLVRDLQRTFPVCVAIAAVLLLVLVRSVLIGVVLLVPAVITVSLTLGLMALLDRPFTVTTVYLPVVLLAYVFADSLHVYYHLQRRSGRPGEGAGDAVAHMVPPCFLASVTTMIGFGSLLTSEVAPVRDFGLLSAAGVLVGFLVATTALPVLLRLVGAPTGAGAGRAIGRVTAAAAARGIRARGLTLGAAGLVLAACAYGAAGLRVESNVLAGYPAGHPVRAGLDFHQRHLAGALRAEVVVVAEQPGAFRRPEALRRLAELQASIESLPELTGALSIANVLSELQEPLAAEGAGVRLPDDEAEVAELLFLASFARRGYRTVDLLDPDERMARIATRGELVSTRRAVEIANHIREQGARAMGPGYRVEVTGSMLALGGSIDTLAWGLVRSLGIAALLLLAVFVALTGSLVWSAVAMLLNLAPVLVAYGIAAAWQGWIGIMDLMVGAVLLGIAVDDTIHVLRAVTVEGRRGAGPRLAMLRGIGKAGAGVLTTTLLLAAGMLAGLASEHMGTQRFATLLAAGVVTALLVDALVLPALADTLRLRSPRRFGWWRPSGDATSRGEARSPD